MAIGRIELCVNGAWSAVCEDLWNRTNAAVACKQLGFSNAGKTSTLCHSMSIPLHELNLGAISNGSFFQLDVESSDDLRLFEKNIACNGTESHLSQCPITEPEDEGRRCGARQNAYIACQGELPDLLEFMFTFGIHSRPRD